MKIKLMLTNTPHPMALRLGYFGLVPFTVLALLTWIVGYDSHPDEHWYVTFLLSSYAAVIVSFLGGIHWGLGFHSDAPTPLALVWGVIPPAVSWIAAVMPPQGGLIVQAMMLIICYLVDRKIYPVEHASDWLTLRLRLTVVASLCCLIAVAGTGPLK